MTDQERDALLQGLADRLQGLADSMARLEHGQLVTATALIELLAAMKEDEKVRSQMRGRISEIKADLESQIA